MLTAKTIAAMTTATRAAFPLMTIWPLGLVCLCSSTQMQPKTPP